MFLNVEEEVEERERQREREKERERESSVRGNESPPRDDHQWI